MQLVEVETDLDEDVEKVLDWLEELALLLEELALLEELEVLEEELDVFVLELEEVKLVAVYVIVDVAL